VLSTHVLALTVMLADGRRVRCSRDENENLFLASLCGLGSTGLILSIRLEVEPATRLREEQYSIPFDDAVSQLPKLVPAADHVRFWWFPQADVVRVSSANRSSEVCGAF
jgi:L-gulonolactone oxidase